MIKSGMVTKSLTMPMFLAQGMVSYFVSQVYGIQYEFLGINFYLVFLSMSSRS